MRIWIYKPTKVKTVENEVGLNEKNESVSLPPAPFKIWICKMLGLNEYESPNKPTWKVWVVGC